MWHAWLSITHHAFFLRVPANVSYIATILLTAKCAERHAGRKAYWAALAIGVAWPFAFQYGRIAGWYTLSTFLLSLVTWIYLWLLQSRSKMGRIRSGWRCVCMVKLVFLLLLADLLLFIAMWLQGANCQLSSRQCW